MKQGCNYIKHFRVLHQNPPSPNYTHTHNARSPAAGTCGSVSAVVILELAQALFFEAGAVAAHHGVGGCARKPSGSPDLLGPERRRV